jgi:hypothetical protein
MVGILLLRKPAHLMNDHAVLHHFRRCHRDSKWCKCDDETQRVRYTYIAAAAAAAAAAEEQQYLTSRRRYTSILFFFNYYQNTSRNIETGPDTIGDSTWHFVNTRYCGWHPMATVMNE